MLVLSSGRYLMRLAGITCIHDDDHRRSTTAARLWTITINPSDVLTVVHIHHDAASNASLLYRNSGV